MKCIQITTIATMRLSRFINISDAEWNEIKDDKEILAFQVNEVHNDSMELLSNEFESVKVS